MNNAEKAQSALTMAGYNTGFIHPRGKQSQLVIVVKEKRFPLHEDAIQAWAEVYDEKVKSAAEEAAKLIDEVDRQITNRSLNNRDAQERLSKAKQLLKLVNDAKEQARGGSENELRAELNHLFNLIDRAHKSLVAISGMDHTVFDSYGVNAQLNRVRALFAKGDSKAKENLSSGLRD